MRRNRRSGNSHDSLLEFVNSIMNNVFMTQTPTIPDDRAEAKGDLVDAL